MLGKGLLLPGTLFALLEAQASVVFTETYSYPDGPLVSVAEGRWKTHSGTSGQVDVRSGRIYLSQKKTEDVSVPLVENGSIGPTNAAALYVRFKFAFSTLPSGASGSYFAHFKDSSITTGLRCRVFACTNGAAAGCFRLGIAAAANAPSALYPQDLNLQTDYQVVCRLVLSNNLSTLWLNPKEETDLCITSTDAAVAKTVTAYAFRQSLASGAGMGELSVDDLVVATTFRESVLAGAPAIVVQPQNQTAAVGTDVTFAVQAEGMDPILYQWLFNGLELPGATDPILTLPGVSMVNDGRYEVAVSDSVGSVTSAPAILTVRPAALALTITPALNSGIQLHWSAVPDQTYSVFASDSVEAGFVLLSGGLCFPDGRGLFVDEITTGSARFYQVCSP